MGCFGLPHHFVMCLGKVAMKESEFLQARNNLAALERDYEEVSISMKEFRKLNKTKFSFQVCDISILYNQCVKLINILNGYKYCMITVTLIFR